MQSRDKSGYQAGDDKAATRVDKSFTYHWAACHLAFGDTRYDKAVTAMFLAIVLLYKRLTGYVSDSFHLADDPDRRPQHPERGIAVYKRVYNARHAANVRLQIYPLLRHVLEAISDHGSQCNSSTAMSAFKGKKHKAQCMRTNQQSKTNTLKVVRNILPPSRRSHSKREMPPRSLERPPAGRNVQPRWPLLPVRAKAATSGAPTTRMSLCRLFPQAHLSPAPRVYTCLYVARRP